MQSIYDYTFEELTSYITSIGDKPFRATQIFEWLYRKRVRSFEEMTNLKESLIEHLKVNFSLELLKINDIHESSDGTKKYLFELDDHNIIETVLMRHSYGNSVCVSSEVGCSMGCSFCASTLLGIKRKLSLAEMVLQVLMVILDLDKEDSKLTNIVVMGIGEPFDNYDNLLRFLKVVNYPKGLEIGARHITVSTCGIVPKIKEFALFPLQINLALSLHAPTNELRNKLMKINQRYPLEEVIDALKYYYEKTNRRITFEYILIDNVNDSKEDAYNLIKLIRGMNAYVNLIPYNEVENKPYKTVSHDKAEEFFLILNKAGINTTLRIKHGDDINAACGQLRIKKIGTNNE